MKFVDQVRIHVKAGDGGNGCVAFRREKYVERGGPSGGDGGNGGSVIFVADPQLTTLLDFRYQPRHFAQDGQAGMGSDCNGSASDDLVLRVPVGTLLKDEASGEVLCDMNEAEQRFVLAKGGRGGLGNINFATASRQTPRFAQDGTKGEEKQILLELKLLADVGLLGFPNAGKSTLISRVSRARPKVADYPFTTLVPNLGMVQYKDSLSFVMADIPGIIEGAAEGAGLGHQFLRHVERCRVLIHMIDLGAYGDDREPLQDFNVLNAELAKYSPELAKKPQIVAANKVDLPYAKDKLPAFLLAMKKKKIPVHAISSATGEGIPALIDAAAGVLYGAGLKRDEDKPKRRVKAQPEPAPATKARVRGKAKAEAKAQAMAKRPKPKTKPKAKPGRKGR